MFDVEVKQMLVRHEGIRIFPYKCSENYLTISCGRNLETNGISDGYNRFHEV